MKIKKTCAITTTRDRKLCFGLLEKWVARQTRAINRWIVVNDGKEEYNYTMNQKVIRREGQEPGWQSFLDNWLVALDALKKDHTWQACLVLEDDEWYSANYVETICSMLEEVDMAGISNSYYFKLPTRRFLLMRNREHASLAATGFTRKMLPLLESVIKEWCCLFQSPFIDIHLWAQARLTPSLQTRLIPNPEKPAYVVGFKHMPGVAGIGLGHRDINQGSKDGAWVWLEGWLGRDAQVYQRLHRELCSRNQDIHRTSPRR